MGKNSITGPAIALYGPINGTCHCEAKCPVKPRTKRRVFAQGHDARFRSNHKYLPSVGKWVYEKRNQKRRSRRNIDKQASPVVKSKHNQKQGKEEMVAGTKTKKQSGLSRQEKDEQDVIGIFQFNRLFPDEEAAIAFVEERRWNGTPECPRCASTNVYRVENKKPQSHRCRPCKRYFSVKTNTVFQGTQIPMVKWLLGIHLMHSSRKATSS
ncbi:MAG: transposase [Chloroflexi bacterium]|nr:transposase [Chloroflexota bacterium]